MKLPFAYPASVPISFCLSEVRFHLALPLLQEAHGPQGRLIQTRFLTSTYSWAWPNLNSLPGIGSEMIIWLSQQGKRRGFLRASGENVFVLGRPKSSFVFFQKMVRKNPNELFGPPSTSETAIGSLSEHRSSGMWGKLLPGSHLATRLRMMVIKGKRTEMRKLQGNPARAIRPHRPEDHKALDTSGHQLCELYLFYNLAWVFSRFIS